MAEMPTHEEKWSENVLFLKYDGKRTEKFYSDGNTAKEASLLNPYDPVGSHIWQGRVGRHEARGDGASRSGTGESNTSCCSCCQAPEIGRILLLACETSEHRGYTPFRSLTMRVNCMSLDHHELSFAAGSLAQGVKSPTTKDLRGAQTCCGCYL